MKSIELFKHIVARLKDRNNESTKMSINHCHARGMFSLVVDGDEPGKLTRIFIAENKLRPFDVQLHTHRYPIKLTSICGNITHHDAVEGGEAGMIISKYSYKSFLNGGSGLSYVGETNIWCSDFKIPHGASIMMNTEQFHTVSCGKGAMWVVEELGFKEEESLVLGVPFVVDGLYSEPAMFQINDKCQMVIRELKRIIEAHDLV